MKDARFGLVITAGEAPDRSRVSEWISQAGRIAAADSGLLLAREWGVAPDVIVGDFDSLQQPELLSCYPHDAVKRYSADKDETDTELAIRLLRESGCEDIRIAGGGGGRLDHLLGIVSLFDRADPPRAWMSDRALTEIVTDQWRNCGDLGRTVSVFPAGVEECEMSSTGLKWPLDGLRWRRGSIGVSNVAVEDCVEITVSRGRLLVVIPWEVS